MTVAALDLRIYGSDGTVLFDSGMFTPVSFSSTETGTGKAGFVFGLNVTQAAQAEAFFTGSNRIGLGSEITDEVGGLETFFVTNIAGAGGGGAGGGEVPEPMSLILIGGGLLVLSLMRKGKVSAQ